MTKLCVFLWFWIAVTLSIHQGDVAAFCVLLPLFLWLWSWAEAIAAAEAPLLTVNTHSMVTVDDALESSTAREDQVKPVGKDAENIGDRSIRC